MAAIFIALAIQDDQPHVQTEDWPNLTGFLFLLQISVLTFWGKSVVFVIFSNLTGVISISPNTNQPRIK